MAWFNACPSSVLDFWMALEWVRHEEETGAGEKMAPSTALERLSERHG